MTIMLLAMDRAPSARRYDAQGFLHLEEPDRISKATVNPYYGREIPGWQALGLDSDRIYQMLRHPDELARAVATFNNLPLLSDHVPITADSIPDDLIIGSTGAHAAFDGTYLTNKPVIWKRHAIRGVETNRARQYSCGYRYTPDMTPGNYQGLLYDGIMRDIVGNHVILTPEGRAGPDIMVGDGNMKINSRVALMVSGAIAGMVRPLLAADAKIDLSDTMADVNAKTLGDPKLGMDRKIAERVVALVTPHLATDKQINVDDVAATVALVPVVAADDEIADPATATPPKPVTPPPVDPKPADPTPVAPPPAMDAAQMQRLTDQARKDALTEAAAIRTAEREVAPYVGEVAALDSAAAVYRIALDSLKVDLTGVPESAFGAVLRALPKPSDTPAIVALDSAARGGAASYLDVVVGADRPMLALS